MLCAHTKYLALFCNVFSVSLTHTHTHKHRVTHRFYGVRTRTRAYHFSSALRALAVSKMGRKKTYDSLFFSADLLTLVTKRFRSFVFALSLADYTPDKDDPNCKGLTRRSFYVATACPQQAKNARRARYTRSDVTCALCSENACFSWEGRKERLPYRVYGLEPNEYY